MKTVFLRVLEVDDKAAAVQAAISDPSSALGLTRFEVDPASFVSVPRSPFAYWASDRVLRLFSLFPACRDRFLVIRGAYTTNDFRFFRLEWETPIGSSARSRNETREGKPFTPLAKGGAWSPNYCDVHLNINWKDDGREAKAHLSAYRDHKGWGTDWSACLNGHNEYFRAGLTWPRRTNGLSFRLMPKGCIFADKGPAAFVEGDDPQTLLALCGMMNSAVFNALVSLQLARTELAQSYEVGLIQQTPVPSLSRSDEATLAALTRRAWSLRRTLDTHNEASHVFSLPALLQVSGSTLAERAANWQGRVAGIEAELVRVQAEIDERCFVLYGIGDEDRQTIERGFGGGATPEDAGEGATEKDDESEEEVEVAADSSSLVAALISWAVGVAFGRFDVRLATGERQLRAEPEPFDPLPRCSPGMLTGEGDLAAPTPPADYPLPVPDHGILVGDEGRAASLTHRVREVFRVVFGDAADDRWDEAATILDPKNRDLRAWLCREFFPLHIKQYSKSRRKAPIYWQLATPSASYAVWLYYPRLTRDTLFRALQDEVAATLQHEERALAERRETAGENPTASQRRDLDAAERLVEELRSFRDEMARVAPLWNPNLDDGVIINFAPLWRLVPQHKAWQRELKATWDALCAGDYDWAHLAMHLWPERVVPKCAEDRSLAIAHGLEEVFWEQDMDAKWTPRDEPTRPIEELIRERTSPAVKAALAGLLDAPQAPGPARRGRGRR